MRTAFKVFFLVSFCGYVSLSLLTPATDRDWTPDQAVSAEAIIEDDLVTVKNVRNFTYQSVTDYSPGYYDTTVKLSDLNSVDFIVEPFGSIGAAHTFVSFGFADGQHIAISAEIRKEKGESFSPWLGLLRQYELMYVIADERDVIGLRANHRKHDVYLYPTTATIEDGRELFLSMLNRANSLREKPEFYNTLTSNCTTNIVQHINELRDEPLEYDWRMLLPANADVLAKELGFVAPDLSIEAARAQYRINEAALEYAEAEDFSGKIRLPRTSTVTAVEVSARVVLVNDGDTIEIVDESGARERVRYIGIDTPEMEYETRTPECLAPEATAHNSELVLGKEVTLYSDVSDTDKYGRLLRYVEVAGTDVGKQLLSGGYAQPLTVPPNLARAADYAEAAKVAREEGLGLWGDKCQ